MARRPVRASLAGPVGDDARWAVRSVGAAPVSDPGAERISANCGDLERGHDVPFVALSIVAGLVVDKLPRRLSLGICSALRFLLLASIPVAAIFFRLSIGQLLVVALVDGSLNVFWMTAYRSLVPEVVSKDRLREAYSLVGVSDGASRTLAPSAVGFVVQALSATRAVGVQALLYLASSIAHLSVKTPPRPREVGERVHLAHGARFLRRNRLAGRLSVAETTYQLFQGIAQGVMVVFLVRTLALSAGHVGLLLSIGTIGGVLAALTGRRFGGQIGERSSVFVGCLARSAGLALLPLATVLGAGGIALAAVGLFINGFGWTFYEVFQDSLQQRAIPDSIRGQVNGAILFLSMGGMCLGTLVASGLSSLLGVTVTLAIGGTLSLAACLWVLPRGLSSDLENT